jgi:hypothetical protein
MNSAVWGIFEIFWLLCGVVTIVAAILAGHSRRALLTGRIAVGALFVLGGALLHVINLAMGSDYATFADPALFSWVTHSWRAVVVPSHDVFIGLLAGFEALVGVLALSGGRRTQLGYAGVIAFYLTLWLFGWIETVWCLVMLPAMILLLRAERHAAGDGPSARAAPIHGEIVINRPVTEVFDYVADQSNEPQYNPRMVRAEKITGGPVRRGTQFRSAVASMGRPAEMLIECTACDRPNLLATITTMDKAEISYALSFEPASSGTRMRWSGQVRPKGTLRLLGPLIAWTGNRQEQRTWTALKEHLEAAVPDQAPSR